MTELATEIILAKLTPEDGWYKRSTEDVVRNVINTLLLYGVPALAAEDVLGNLISAIAEEYGD